VKELIQDDLTVENLKKELEDILINEPHIAELKKDYADLKSLLSKDGNASAKAADSIVQYLSEK